MKNRIWTLAAGSALLALSALFYFLQIILFQRVDDTRFYLLQDLAFLPVQVLLVTLIVDRLLTRRERQHLLEKMNMAIGTFYAEVGTDLLQRLLALDANRGVISAGLALPEEWTPRRFQAASLLTRQHVAQIKFTTEELGALRQYLLSHRDFLLRFLENPNLLEHDSFTDCLWAVFHLIDELAHRKNLQALPDADLRHLAGDMDRAYKLVVLEWLAYMKHLKKSYPYLFSLALRTNPFDPSARVEIENPLPA
jgi:hypothetical protein